MPDLTEREQCSRKIALLEEIKTAMGDLPKHPMFWKRSSVPALRWIIVDLLAALH
jgi:hypothetical protein